MPATLTTGELQVRTKRAKRRARADPVEALPTADKSEDGFNAAVYALNRDRALADVRGAFDAGHERLLRFVEAVSDEALARRYGFISGNADGHYDEHARMVEAWQAREK